MGAFKYTWDNALFWETPENKIGMEMGGGGGGPICEQSFVSLTPLFYSVIRYNIIAFIRKQHLLEVHKWADLSKIVGQPTLTLKQKVSRNPVRI